MGNFLNELHLDRSKIKEKIIEYCNEEFTTYVTTEIENIKDTQYRCTINGDNKEIVIDFYYKLDGRTTIKPTGKNYEDSFKIALNLKLNLCNVDIGGASYSIKIVEDEVVSLLIEYLLELNGVTKLNEDKTDIYKLFRFKGILGDKIVIKHFNNKRLQIQGKPLHLYQEITCFLAEYFPFEEIIKSQSEFFNVSITREEIQEELDNLLPNSKNFLGERLKSILSPALAYKQIDIFLPDYSGFVFPVLRALEGYIKLLFLNNNIKIKKKNGFDEHIFFDDYKYFLRPETKALIDCNDTCLAIERSFNYFNQHRNQLFHADGIDANIRLVETKKEAVRIINNTFAIIEETYNSISFKS